MDRTVLLYALLFSVPPGVGVIGYTQMMTDGGLVSPLGVVAGAVTTAVIFVVVFFGASGEEPEPVEGFAK